MRGTFSCFCSKWVIVCVPPHLWPFVSNKGVEFLSGIHKASWAPIDQQLVSADTETCCWTMLMEPVVYYSTAVPQECAVKQLPSSDHTHTHTLYTQLLRLIMGGVLYKDSSVSCKERRILQACFTLYCAVQWFFTTRPQDHVFILKQAETAAFAVHVNIRTT